MVESRELFAGRVLVAGTVLLCRRDEHQAVAVSFIGESMTPYFLWLPAAEIEAVRSAVDGLFANPAFGREWVGGWAAVGPPRP